MSKQFKFVIHPSWFGGANEADKAVVELAEHHAAHNRKHHSPACCVANIWVDRTNSERWKATVEFSS